MKPLLSVDETVKELEGALGPRAIRDGIARGEIPGQRFGRLLKVPRWWVDQMKHGPAAKQLVA